jgi:hypothetical protein
LTLDICRSIKALDFDSDPADEIIAATSVVHRVPLLTRDRRTPIETRADCLIEKSLGAPPPGRFFKVACIKRNGARKNAAAVNCSVCFHHRRFCFGQVR